MKWIRTLLLHGTIQAVSFAPVWLTGDLLAPDDGLHFFIPAFFSSDRIWNPFLMCGFPVFADPQSLSWSPLARVCEAIPLGLASWNLFVVLGFALAGAFMHRWVASFTRSELAGFASGVAYGMSGFLVAHLRHVNLVHTAAWMPLVFLTIDRLRENPSRRRIAATAAATGMAVLAGHPQTLLHLGIVAVAYAVFGVGARGTSSNGNTIAPPSRRAFASAATAALLLGCSLSAISLVPFAQLATLADRWTVVPVETLRMATAWSDLRRLLVTPAFLHPFEGTERVYDGMESALISLIAACLGIIGVFAGKRRGRFLAVVAIVGTILALGWTTPIGRFADSIPLLNRLRAPERHFVEVHFAISALAGIGIAALARRTKRGAVMVSLLLLVELAVAAQFSEWRSAPRRPEAFERPETLDLVHQELERSGQRMIAALGTAGSRACAPVNRCASWEIPNASGYNPLRLADDAALIPYGLAGRISERVVLGPHVGLDLAAGKYMTVPADQLKSMALQLANAPRWRTVSSRDGALLFENTRALPRAWLASQSLRLDRERILDAIRSGALAGGAPFDPARTVLVEEAIPELSTDEAAPRADTENTTQDAISVELNRGRIARVTTSAEGWRALVVSDAWYPGWRARLDGRPTPIVRADVHFMAVVLPPGSHEVTFNFMPGFLVLGASISALAVLVTLWLACPPRVRHLAKKAKPAVTSAE